MHARVVLGVGKVSCLERYPQFRSVLIERFYCIYRSRNRFYQFLSPHSHTE